MAREPLALVAVVAAALLLGLVAAGGPLFVSSVGAGALHVAAGCLCAQDDQVTVMNPALNVYLHYPAQAFPRKRFAADRGTVAAAECAMADV